MAKRLTTKEARKFMEEIEAICKKFDIRIQHEDHEGAFILARGQGHHGIFHGCVTVQKDPNDYDTVYLDE